MCNKEKNYSQVSFQCLYQGPHISPHYYKRLKANFEPFRRGASGLVAGLWSGAGLAAM